MIIKMVTDLCMWVDLPLDKKIVQNQDWAAGPQGHWAVGRRAYGLLGRRGLRGVQASFQQNPS